MPGRLGIVQNKRLIVETTHVSKRGPSIGFMARAFGLDIWCKVEAKPVSLKYPFVFPLTRFIVLP